MDTANDLVLKLNYTEPQVPGENLKVIMQNKDKTDIRIYTFMITVIPKPINATIEIKVPTEGSITQEIPILN